MDTSKEYIEMCEKATEIQKIGKRYLGVFPNIPTDIFRAGKVDAFVWLPRQDQLLEMIKGDFIETCDYIGHFSERFIELKTPEKILLKIVMEETYHKQWTGENWEKI